MDKATLIGKRIKLLRLERGLSQGDVEKASGVCRSHISSIESGKVINPGLHTLERLATALKVSISYLMHFDEKSLRRRIRETEKRKKEQKSRKELLERREKEIKKLRKELRRFTKSRSK
ncbi:MAG: helix-turn-helix domain-containing protein [Candidatus Aminicenantes bacterium]|jgi:transcriptional regulator with XRE-family HTH domain